MGALLAPRRESESSGAKAPRVYGFAVDRRKSTCPTCRLHIGDSATVRDESANGAIGSLVFDNDKYVGLMIPKPIKPWARREPILVTFESDATGTLSRDLYHLESLAFFKPKFFCVQVSQIKLAARFIRFGVMSDFYILPDLNRDRSVF